jgi:hypothetical protein
MELLDMRKKIAGRTVGRIVAGAFALLLLVTTGAKAQSPTGLKKKYQKMAPINEYLMDRDAEIAMARTAAPEAISRDAEVLVLGRHSYETAVKGTNGFICLVERSWNTGSGDLQFWNPKKRGPNCYNPQAARTILPLILKRAEMALAGMSKDQIIDGIKAFGKKEVPALEPGAVCYMMSKEAYLTDADGHNMSHLMFYLPEGTDWGAGLPGSPVLQGQKLILGTPEPVTEYFIPMRKWSDGTPQ